MGFVTTDIESFLQHLNKLEPTTKANWGSMSAQRMVEHLSEMIDMSMGKGSFTLQIDPEKVSSMQRFLDSDKPIAKGVKVDFAAPEAKLRNDELELAIDEFVDKWLAFEEYYESHPGQTNLHPFYGDLDEAKWRRLHAKHFTHHFEQFGIL